MENQLGDFGPEGVEEADSGLLRMKPLTALLLSALLDSARISVGLCVPALFRT